MDEWLIRHHHELARQLVDEVASSADPQVHPIVKQVDDVELFAAILAAKVVDVQAECDERLESLHVWSAVEDAANSTVRLPA